MLDLRIFKLCGKVRGANRIQQHFSGRLVVQIAHDQLCKQEHAYKEVS